MKNYVEIKDGIAGRIFSTDQDVALNKGLVKELVDDDQMAGFDSTQHVPTTSYDLVSTPARRISGYRAMTSAEFNAPIDAQLDDIDRRSIRAIREGNTTRIAEWEAQAAALRATRRK